MKALPGAIVLAGCVLATAAHAQYVYNSGPNYVNMSGSRCRAGDATSAQYLRHNAGSTSVVGGVGSIGVYCPVVRRSTEYYGQVAATDGPKRVDVETLYVRAQDANTGASISCYVFAKGLGSGSIVYGSTRYICSTDGGCSSLPTASWQGTNYIYFPQAMRNRLSVNWGVRCSLPANSSIHHYEAGIVPN